MPHVIALYEKYKDKGLKVIGITVSDTPEKSDSVVQKMGIPFPQIYESKPMSIYGVTGISISEDTRPRRSETMSISEDTRPRSPETGAGNFRLALPGRNKAAGESCNM
jgi:hypothetical protein